MSSEDWSDRDNDAIVADYFAMLADELARRPYNKSAHRRVLTGKLGRSDGSIEYKHQNISAVLKGFGETWVSGYKPAFNFQSSLEQAVDRWLAANPSWTMRDPSQVGSSELAEPAELWIGPPPTHSNQPEPQETQQMVRLAQKYDVSGRDERNRVLGHAGEKRVLAHEKAMLARHGRRDLANKVDWISQTKGDGVGYDIASFGLDGSVRLIEVKTTNGWERTPFHISRNEIAVAEERRHEWCLVRLWDFSREPRAYELRPPLDAHVSLTPTSFLANLH